MVGTNLFRDSIYSTIYVLRPCHRHQFLKIGCHNRLRTLILLAKVCNISYEYIDLHPLPDNPDISGVGVRKKQASSFLTVQINTDYFKGDRWIYALSLCYLYTHYNPPSGPCKN